MQFVTQGNPISKEKAKIVALNFLKQVSVIEGTPDNVIVQAFGDNVITDYLVTVDDKGWVWLAGDDQVEAILGFGKGNNFELQETTQYPFSDFFEEIRARIGKAIHNGNGVVDPQWNVLYTGETLKSATVSDVEPFIRANFNQGKGWNQFCPLDEAGPGGHTYVGCVAVAMAQAMSYYQYPVSGVGYHDYFHGTYGKLEQDFSSSLYHWPSMSMTGSDEYNALLLYDCAVSVDMDFAPDGSGAYTFNVPDALITYFSYGSSVKYVKRSSKTDSEWRELLTNEIKNFRPVIYSGDGDNDEAGHAFNLDGIKGNLFHVNWGYSGSMNGYYDLDGLTVNGNNFSLNGAAVIGIVPADFFDDSMYPPTDITLSNTHIEEGIAQGSFVSLVKVVDETPEDTFKYECYGQPLVAGGYKTSEFYIENDTLRSAMVFNYDDKKEYSLTIRVTDNGNNTYMKNFTIMVDVKTGFTDFYNDENSVVYPNPANKIINVRNNARRNTLFIFNISGQKIRTYPLHEGINQLDVSMLPKGVYLLTPQIPVFKNTKLVVK